MREKIKLVCLYQVVMHYRLPFYNRISKDPEIDFTLIHGKGLKEGKLRNTNLDNVTFRRFQIPELRIPLPFSPLLLFYLMRESPKIVFTEGSSSLINASIAFFYAKLFKKKFIWWSLGTLTNKKYSGLRKFINRWEKYIEKSSDAIFTYSTQGRNYFLSRGVDDKKIYVAVNVFDTETKLEEIKRFYIEGYLDDTCFNIGFIGTIQKTKNLQLLVDAVQKLNERYKNIRLHIIGDGTYLAELQRYVGESTEIKFYGRMNEGASKILGNCDAFVLPGLGGLAICEGMLNSLPIITGNADGTEYDLVGDENGFIIEDMNLESLCNKIEYLYNNPTEREKMKINSFRRITNEFSFEHYYNVFKDMVRKLTE
ncbi:glycosyltransferase family 4 protein [Sphingobacterium sp. SGR-19]|uniref:glycosyltransferase family 4 protein n=1 Tax=Sphingobacterium sp. SGR-19 TaxID=2710886 RepID=UPI0013EC4BBA|nr:glycosyltransferase family 4 protein [Sphingobacterium sp. SGR-19]NGM67220.1 glycosyltransferase family 4 protein [Sphingobacterium sp. SGR-19]